MARGSGSVNIGSGRRGYWRYLYGSHFWIPTVESEFGRGIARDSARISIAPGGCYDSADYLLHEPGVAIKRGGTSYAGPVMDTAAVAAYRADALGFSPGLYLEFEETAGSATAADSSGNANTATAVNSPTFGSAGLVPGGSGFAMDNNGWTGHGASFIGSHLTVADAASINPTTGFWLATWLRFDEIAVNHSLNFTVLQKGSLLVQIVVTRGSSGSSTGQVLYQATDSGGNLFSGTLAVNMAPSTVYMFDVSDDGTTVKVYLNGSLAASATRVSMNAAAGTGFSGISGNTLYIGDAAAGGANFSGTFDEFGVYKDVVPSAANITTLWNARVTSTSFARACAYAEFPAGAQIVAVSDTNHLFEITSGAATDLGGQTVSGGTVDRPKLRVGGTQHLLVVPCADGTTAPVVYDGSAAPVLCGGSPPGMKFIEIFKGRLVGAGESTNPQRLFFSPAVDITSTWDTSESWIDATHAVTGLAALRNTLLIFSQGHTERIVGTTPPPGSDMDLAPLGDVGCTDARSIIVQEGNCLFANPRGVWLTNGAGFASLTTEGGIESYWQSLLSGYDPSAWVISSGILRSYLIVTVIDGSGNSTTLMCNVPRRAWWRLTNFNAQMYSQAVGKQDELYYADSELPRVVAVSGIFMPSAANKNDANGLAVQPMLETRAIGDGPDLKAYGDGHVMFDMRDAASDNPTMTVEFAPGTEATTYRTATESPLTETTDVARKRFSTGVDSQAVSVRLTQTNASSKTEIYAIELANRSFPVAAEGQ